MDTNTLIPSLPSFHCEHVAGCHVKTSRREYNEETCLTWSLGQRRRTLKRECPDVLRVNRTKQQPALSGQEGPHLPEALLPVCLGDTAFMQRQPSLGHATEPTNSIHVLVSGIKIQILFIKIRTILMHQLYTSVYAPFLFFLEQVDMWCTSS